MHLKLTGFLLMAVLLGGCAKTPLIAPPAMRNPANANAPAGPAISRRDFINVADASAQIAPPEVTAGEHLPTTGITVKPARGHKGDMGSMPGMKGMNMSGMGTMGAMKMGSNSSTTGQGSNQ